MTKDIKDWIKTNAEPDFAKFAASLVPGLKHEMHGVRLPKLRQKAKELTTVIDDIPEDSCEEILLKAFAIGYLRDIEKQMSEVVKFVPKIDNWMVCDSFCGALQKAKTHQQLYWDMIAGYAAGSNDYERRFAYVMMLKYFCNETYIGRVLALLGKAKPETWDGKQGLAWALAECFIKFPEQTRPVLQKIPPEIYKLTRRKILDSKRVDAQVKQALKNENRVDCA